MRSSPGLAFGGLATAEVVTQLSVIAGGVQPSVQPSSSDARFALDPEREGRRYTSPLKNIPAVPAGRALRGGTRVRGLEGLVDHRYESKNDGDCLPEPPPGAGPWQRTPRG